MYLWAVLEEKERERERKRERETEKEGGEKKEEEKRRRKRGRNFLSYRSQGGSMYIRVLSFIYVALPSVTYNTS